MTSLSSASSSTPAHSTQLPPPWTMRTSSSTKFPTRTLSSSTPWRVVTHAPPPHFAPFYSFHRFCPQVSSQMTTHSRLFSRPAPPAKQLHCYVIKCGMQLNIFVCPALINMYTECSDVDVARQVFDKIPEPCVVVQNAMITGYARNSHPNEALSLFRELQASGLKPTDVTMLSALSSCALLGALDLGKWIHEYVKKNRFDRYVKVNTALIDM
ncbi:hypothetical protein ACLB2K_042966 [Fragaria x ananassa]